MKKELESSFTSFTGDFNKPQLLDSLFFLENDKTEEVITVGSRYEGSMGDVQAC